MSKKAKYIGYYRVSTEKQGKSGWGLNAQMAAVRAFAKNNGQLLDEFQDIESGAKADREGLRRAINAAKFHGAVLLVKDVSRISRGGLQSMAELERLGIDYVQTDSPGDDSLVKGVKISIAKQERENISLRTKAALKQIKLKIDSGEHHTSKAGNVVHRLGNPENFTDAARQLGGQATKKKALENSANRMAHAFASELYKNGSSYPDIQRALNRAGFMTSAGNEFSYMAVKRLFNLFKNQ